MVCQWNRPMLHPQPHCGLMLYVSETLTLPQTPTSDSTTGRMELRTSTITVVLYLSVREAKGQSILFRLCNYWHPSSLRSTPSGCRICNAIRCPIAASSPPHLRTTNHENSVKQSKVKQSKQGNVNKVQSDSRNYFVRGPITAHPSPLRRQRVIE